MGRTWTCSRCHVRVTFPSGGPQPPTPTGWAQIDGEWRCLGCRRQEVAESASAGNGADRNKRRRRALTEFELMRDPGASDQLIAKRVRCPTALVGPVRASLRGARKVPSAKR
jgi:hypothetical protein